MNQQIPSMIVLLVALLGSTCPAQQPTRSSSAKLLACGESAGQSGNSSRYRAIRVFEDPSTHRRWMMLQDLTRPSAPATLASMPASSGSAVRADGMPDHLASCFPPPSVAVIRAGDAVVIAEHSAVVDAELEAIALGRAAVGEPLRVRLKSGGHILSVIADGSGRATLYTGSEARP